MTTCPVFFGAETFADWDAFASADSSYTISGDTPFVISDVSTAAPQIVSNVIAGKS